MSAATLGSALAASMWSTNSPEATVSGSVTLSTRAPSAVNTRTFCSAEIRAASARRPQSGGASGAGVNRTMTTRVQGTAITCR